MSGRRQQSAAYRADFDSRIMKIRTISIGGIFVLTLLLQACSLPKLQTPEPPSPPPLTLTSTSTSVEQTIGTQIKSNIRFKVPKDLAANLPAVFKIDLFPDGLIMAASLLKSSGIPDFDKAVRVAIEKSQPYPKDEAGFVPQTIELVSYPKDGPDGQWRAKNNTAKMEFDTGMALFLAARYGEAEASFLNLLQRFSDSEFTPYARYWLGCSYYAQLKYQKAISEQRLVVGDYPSLSITPSALMNMASAYFELGEKSLAKKTLEQVISTYPDSSEATIARMRLGIR